MFGVLHVEQRRRHRPGSVGRPAGPCHLHCVPLLLLVLTIAVALVDVLFGQTQHCLQ
jgi:hypothetical protein